MVDNESENEVIVKVSRLLATDEEIELNADFWHAVAFIEPHIGGGNDGPRDAFREVGRKLRKLGYGEKIIGTGSVYLEVKK